MDAKDNTVEQIENHYVAGRYQACRWSGSAWVPVAKALKPVYTSLCPRCHSYCQGDCSAHR